MADRLSTPTPPAAPAAGALTDEAKQAFSYHLEEFKTLKAEIAEDLKTLYSNYQYAVGGSGAVAVLFISQKDNIDKLSWYLRGSISLLPLLVSMLFAAMSLTLYYRFDYKKAYLLILEDRFGFAELGWEKHWKTVPAKLTGMYIGMWYLLLLLDGVLAVVVTRN